MATPSRMFEVRKSTSCTAEAVTPAAAHAQCAAPPPAGHWGLGEGLAALPAWHTCTTPCRYEMEGPVPLLQLHDCNMHLTCHPVCFCRTSRA